MKFIIGAFHLKETFIRKSKAWLTAQWEESAWFDQSEQHHPKMTFFENLVAWLTVQWEKWTGGRSFFLRAARDDNISWSNLMSNIIDKVLNLKFLDQRFFLSLLLYMSHQGREVIWQSPDWHYVDASETNLCVQRNNVAKFKVCVTRIFLDAKVLQKSCRGALNGAEW